jgi:uncharacterized protein
MAAYLLDANVLIALAWPEHGASERAGRWFARHAPRGWATCPMTQAALVRVLSSPAFSEHALTPTGALEVLSRNIEVPEHEFWSDSIGVKEAVERMPQVLTGHRQITDAYLVGLAMHKKGKLATLDRGLQQWAPAGSVEVIK